MSIADYSCDGADYLDFFEEECNYDCENCEIRDECEEAVQLYP